MNPSSSDAFVKLVMARVVEGQPQQQRARRYQKCSEGTLIKGEVRDTPQSSAMFARCCQTRSSMRSSRRFLRRTASTSRTTKRTSSFTLKSTTNTYGPHSSACVASAPVRRPPCAITPVRARAVGWEGLRTGSRTDAPGV